jgi:hypothetical protein
MKIFSILCLILICFTLQSNISEAGRDFLQAFLSEVKGQDVKLDESCLGAEFDKDVTDLMEALKNYNFANVLVEFHKVAEDIEKKCPSNDLVKIYNDMVALGPFEILKRINNHKVEVLTALKEILIPNKITAKTLGKALGVVIKIWVYEPTKMLGFLEESHEFFSSWSVEQFVDGFFEGVASGPITENKCFNDLGSARGDIVEAISKIVDTFKNKDMSQLLDAIQKLINVVLKSKDISSNCHFVELGAKLATLATKVGIAKLGWQAVTHIKETVGDIKDFSVDLYGKKFEDSGKDFGKLFKLLLGWSTD